jgi:lipopolysaccharide biosynthesis glycosyltransferase
MKKFTQKEKEQIKKKYFEEGTMFINKFTGENDCREMDCCDCIFSKGDRCIVGGNEKVINHHLQMIQDLIPEYFL